MNKIYLACLLLISLSACKRDLLPIADFALEDQSCLDSCTLLLRNRSLYAEDYEWVVDGDTQRSTDAIIRLDSERRYEVQLTAFNKSGESDVKVTQIDFEFFRLEALSATITELPFTSSDNFSENDVYVRFLDSEGEIALISEVKENVGGQEVPIRLEFPNRGSVRPGTYTVQIMDDDSGPEDDQLYEFRNVVITQDMRTLELRNTPAAPTITFFFRRKG